MAALLNNDVLLNMRNTFRNHNRRHLLPAFSKNKFSTFKYPFKSNYPQNTKYRKTGLHDISVLCEPLYQV